MGCGAQSEPEDARGAAERYVQALSDRDGEAACAELSAGAVTEIENTASKPCPKALDTLLEGLGGEGADLEVKEVNAAEDLGTVAIDGPRGEIVSELVLEDGEWKLTSPGGR